ncbi:putative class I glutamine amidotransferase [Rosa chinensis]|uniref:Putative class I glutamine amidotransferase n=1 Tax=Rosa chinensis TaxID=74649 RepID=A0A2P6RU21_ROSCH|nr:protein DJ-1 homolog B [Rosa chinensis]PRQ49937.1 putative class I glutamine amidotransferase [Rosa chinensis]
MASASPAKKVLVPIANGKEPVDAVIAVDVLRRAGADVTVASVEKQLRVEACHGVKIIADALVSHCGQSSFDLITLPGGMPGTTNLKNSESYEHILETLFHLCNGCVYMVCNPAIANEKITYYLLILILIKLTFTVV